MDNGKTSGILKLKCPRCMEGNLFAAKSAYNIRDLGKMPPECTNCGQDYVIEPGFYFGATYISYGITVAFLGIGFLLNWLIIGWNLEIAAPVLVSLFVLISPMVFRLSRSVWIHTFVKYDPAFKSKAPNPSQSSHP
ncbi:DUF983 domain-containing protein [bacterium]|nr:DUF983 domain-containing protein [bacterium]